MYRTNLPKKRRKLDCFYYSPLAFDKYGCKCKTGSGSARPETRFIHIHLARPRIGMMYLAKFLPSRQSHSINSECTYLAWMLPTCRMPRAIRIRAHMRAFAYTISSMRMYEAYRAVVYSREYLAKYFTHRGIFTHYSSPGERGCIFIALVIIIGGTARQPNSKSLYLNLTAHRPR